MRSPFALGPQAADQRDMKAVQLHSGVKMFLKLFYDGRAQHRLGPVNGD